MYLLAQGREKHGTYSVYKLISKGISVIRVWHTSKNIKCKPKRGSGLFNPKILHNTSRSRRVDRGPKIYSERVYTIADQSTSRAGNLATILPDLEGDIELLACAPILGVGRVVFQVISISICSRVGKHTRSKPVNQNLPICCFLRCDGSARCSLQGSL